MSTTPVRTPTITPYPTNGTANPYVPVGATGLPVSKNALPIPMTPIQGGTNWINNTYGYTNTGGINTGNYAAQGTPVNTNQIINSVATSPPPSNNPPAAQATDPLKQQTSAYGYYNGNGDWVSLGNYITPEGNYYQGSEADYNREIDNYYNAAMGALNTAGNTLNTNFGLTKSQAESDYAANTSQLGTNRTQSLGQLDTQQRAGQSRKEDALAAARRLYQGLQLGNRQRFGGATSAGLAASEIQGAEMQRQMGQTNRQANEFFQQIDQARTDVESQYQTGLLQLKQAKDQAINSAQIEFNNKMADIERSKADTEGQKAQMRLNALMDLRNKAFAIQQQNLAFEQQLAAMREQSKLNIDAYAKTTGSNLNNTTNAYNTFGTQAGTGYSFSRPGQTTSTTPQTQYVGQIGRSTNTGNQYYDERTGQWVNY